MASQAFKMWSDTDATRCPACAEAALQKKIKKRASMHVYSMHVETPVYTGVHTSVCLYSVGHKVTLLLVLVSVRIPTRRFVP